MIKKIFIAALLVTLIKTVHCQPYDFRHYQVENGLSNNATICSLQDSKGFLWFGTKDGLNRFDGYIFRVYRDDPDNAGSIGSNFIHSLYEDKNATIWVGTESGLYKYNAQTESFSLLGGTANARIRDIKMDETGNLWFIMGFTLTKYNESKKHLESYDTTKYFEATSISIDATGVVWASTSNGEIKKYDARKNSFSGYNMFSHSKNPASKWIEKIYCTTKGTILVGTSNQGTKLFDISTSTYKDILTYNTDKTEIFVRNFIQTSDDEYWIATETGVFIYNTSNEKKVNIQKKFTDPYSISDNAIYSFCKDKEGGIWVCTYFGGVNYYPHPYTPFKKFFPKTEKNSLSGNVIREIHGDSIGNLWIGTEDAGLNKLEKATGKFINYKPSGKKGSISYTNIHGMLVNHNELWVGTFEHGLDVLNIKTGNVFKHYSMGSSPNSLKSNFIYFISKIDQETIVFGTTRGAYSYNRDKDDFSPLPGLPINNWYTSIVKDNTGIIWAGTYGNGVNYYNTNLKTNGNFRYNPSNKSSLSSDRVNSIFEDSNKNLWFATEGGLCKLVREKNEFKRYTTKDGFPSNFILSILEDKQANLWISTSKGLVCFRPNEEKAITYTVANGILNDQFNFNSAYQDKEGTMYFGSEKGLINFNPARFTSNVFIPPVYITGFQVFNKDLTIGDNNSPLKKSILYTDKIVLDYDQSTVNIGFAALGYSSPDKTEYAYKMEGLDKNWTYLKRNRNAYFTGLRPGTYVFKVRASNVGIDRTEQETKLIVQILPPWWASKLAYVFYLLLVVIIVHYSFHYYHKSIEKKNRRKFVELEGLKEKEIFKAKLEFFTNVAHEIRTPLTLIKAPLEKVIKKADGLEISNNLKIMERNTNRLIQLTNQLLDFRQIEIESFNLNLENVNIATLLEEAYVSFKPLAEQKNLTFDLKLPQSRLLASVDVDAFNKILFNLYGNAVKYAKSKVRISVLHYNEQNNFFTIEIKNDGFLIPLDKKDKIFEPFFRLKETEKQKGTGIGLALSRSLVQLHNGVLDLKEPEKNQNVFSLTMPILQENDLKSAQPNETLTIAKTTTDETNNIIS